MYVHRIPLRVPRTTHVQREHTELFTNRKVTDENTRCLAGTQLAALRRCCCKHRQAQARLCGFLTPVHVYTFPDIYARTHTCPSRCSVCWGSSLCLNIGRGVGIMPRVYIYLSQEQLIMRACMYLYIHMYVLQFFIWCFNLPQQSLSCSRVTEKLTCCLCTNAGDHIQQCALYRPRGTPRGT